MKKILMIFCVVFAVFADFGDTWTDPETGVTWTYTVSDGEAIVGDGATLGNSIRAVPTSTTGAVEIPSVLGGCAVTSIGTYAFYNCSSLMSVTIPEGVTSIGRYAFRDCSSLTSVTIPEGVTRIGGGAFSGCSSLTSVTIPEGVTSIEERTFYDCSSLMSVTIPEGVTSIEERTFYNCSSLMSVTIPEGVTSIGTYAFCNCSSITNLTIFEGPVEISDATFYGCVSLEKVSIPLSVERMSYCSSSTINSSGKDIFGGCRNVKDVTVSDRVPLANVFKESYQGITNVALHTGVETTGDWLCNGCSSLTSVTIPEGVTRIGSGAFCNCTALPSVTIPESVTSIGNNAFYRCLGLRDVTVPFNVMSVENEAFLNCSSITNISFKGDMPDFGEDVFVGTRKRMVLTIQEDAVWWDYYEKYGLIPPWGAREVIVVKTSDDDKPTGGDGSITSISLTVTNVVVHYIFNSIQPDIAVPISGDAGFTTVITEVKSTGAVCIPSEWKDNYAGFEAKFGTDFANALRTKSGKKDCANNELLVWQDFVAGTDPTDEDDVFTASITMVGGKPMISYTPELSAEETAKRVYTISGKKSLTDGSDWEVVAPGSEADYNFFKVTVRMK